MGITVAVSIIMAVGIFMILPYFISNLLRNVTDSAFLIALGEGVIRIVIFLAYIILISRMKDIQRVFMYHGAEHKCINCIEHGLDLTVENVRKSSKHHKRCGTSFLLIVNGDLGRHVYDHPDRFSGAAGCIPSASCPGGCGDFL